MMLYKQPDPFGSLGLAVKIRYGTILCGLGLVWPGLPATRPTTAVRDQDPEIGLLNV